MVQTVIVRDKYEVLLFKETGIKMINCPEFIM
jgi:hypothetical protein